MVPVQPPAAVPAVPHVLPVDPTSAAAVLRPALLLWLTTQLVSGSVAQVTAFVWRGQDDYSSAFFMWLYELNQVAVAGLVVFFVWPHREARVVFCKPRPRMVELCVVVGVVASLLLSMWERQIPVGWSSGLSPCIVQFTAGWPMWASLVSSAMAPAVFEELMFRGLLLQRFSRVMSIELAIAVQAMLFSVTHFDPVFVLPHFVFGVVAGLLRVAAGALWPCMLMHFLWNGSIVLWLYGWV